MRISLLLAAVVTVTMFVKPAQATVATSVDWTSPGAGDLNGIGVTFFPSGESVTSFDLSGPNYSAAPLSAATETTNYDSGTDWTVTLVSEL